MATMINFFKFGWVMTNDPIKGIYDIGTEMNVKLLAKRLQLFGNQNYQRQIEESYEQNEEEGD